MDEICLELKNEIWKAYMDGFTVFITGMARGTDIFAGEAVLQLRKEGVPVRLLCISPHEGFESKWSVEWRIRYKTMIKNADFVRYVCTGYCFGCYQLRNEWLVDHSARVIAVYNGQPGGTRNTIEYAYRKGIPVIQIRG